MSENLIYQTLWNHFEIHAKQRTQVFNFYLVVISALFTVGIYSTNKFDQSIYWYEIIAAVIGVAGILVTSIFYLLDLRNKQLIKIAEGVLIQFEQTYIDDRFQIFTQERLLSNASKLKSHSFCFNAFFILCALGFVILIIVAMVSVGGHYLGGHEIMNYAPPQKIH